MTQLINCWVRDLMNMYDSSYKRAIERGESIECKTDCIIIPTSTLPNYEARVDAERTFREVYSVCLSGDALEQRIQERLRVWDVDRHGRE